MFPKPSTRALRLGFEVVAIALLAPFALVSVGTVASAARSTGTSGLSLTLGITNRGPLTSCDAGSCGLASTTQFMLYVQNANPLVNFAGPPPPNRDNIPNSYVISSVDQTATVDGATFPARHFT